MKLNWKDRLWLKLAGRKVRSMDGLKRWSPLVGAALLAVTVVLHALGQADAAKAIESIGGLVGLTSDPAISKAELVAAAAVLIGVIRKLKAEVEKAQAKAAEGESK